MSKIPTFRARAVDTNKPMPVLRSEENPDLPDSGINRNVQQMPTGMEKEEESEHHLQRAISAQQAYGRAVDHVIPTPEVYPIDEKDYDELYPPNYKIPRQLVRVQFPCCESEEPEYDIDSEDEVFLNEIKPQFEVKDFARKFEESMEYCEKNCSGYNSVSKIAEAAGNVKNVESTVSSLFYDYWITKRLLIKKSLMPTVKTEKRDGIAGSNNNNPYIAFRRRIEKMQTRKNRKNDEASYEKMIKLKRDFQRVQQLMGMIVNRENMKKELFNTSETIFELRYALKDYDGRLFKELEQKNSAASKSKTSKGDENIRKRRNKRQRAEVLSMRNTNYTSEDENSSDVFNQSNQINERDDDPDGAYAFKRKNGCNYHAPLPRLQYPRFDSDDDNDDDEKISRTEKNCRFNITSISYPPKYCVRFCRQRIGRGGRRIFDIKKSYNPNLDDNGYHLDDLDDEPKTKKTHYLPLLQNSNIDFSTIEFNVKQFENYNDNDNVNDNYNCFENNPLENFYQESSLREQFYQFHQNKLMSYIEEKNQQFSEMYKAPRDNSPKSTVSKHVEFLSVDDCNSIVNLIQNFENNTQDLKPENKNELKESSFLISNSDNTNDDGEMIVDGFSKNNDEQLRVSANNTIENFNSNYNKSPNGSECFNSNEKDKINFTHEITSPCKKLNNQKSSNLHPTDVT